MPQPDHLLTLSTERTYLAYVRTSLALFAGSSAVLAYFDLVAHGPLAILTGLGLFAVGVLTLIGGHLRWRKVNRAILAGEPMPQSVMPALITTFLLAVALVSLAAILVG